jgi:hypothetical protein
MSSSTEQRPDTPLDWIEKLELEINEIAPALQIALDAYGLAAAQEEIGRFLSRLNVYDLLTFDLLQLASLASNSFGRQREREVAVLNRLQDVMAQGLSHGFQALALMAARAVNRATSERTGGYPILYSLQLLQQLPQERGAQAAARAQELMAQFAAALAAASGRPTEANSTS